MHEGIDRVFRRRFDVNQTVVRADFEVLATVFVDKRAAQNAEAPNAGREGNRTGDLCAGSFHRVDDLRSGRIQTTVIERLQLDANLRSCHDLLRDGADYASTNRVTPFANCETQTFFHGDWLDELNR